MNAAIEAVINKEMGYEKASKQFNVPKRTLERYVKSHEDSSPFIKLRMGRKPALSEVIEEELEKYYIHLDQRFYGLRLKDVRHLAFQIAIKNNAQHPFSQSKKIAGTKWLRGFLRRHPTLSIRTPQAISAARTKGFTQENVNSFFDIYETEFAKIKCSPHRVYNVDETGITVVQHKHSKVLNLKGKKQVYALTSLERGKLITVATCMNAIGHYIPPLIIFPRKNKSPELMDGTPCGSIDGYHPSGWMQTDLFTKWLHHFVEHTKPSEDNAIVLIFDGHYTHTRNIDVIDFARENHISIVCLPPHSTHKMQPMDVGFMFPLKTYYAQAIETWLRNNPGRTVTVRQVGMLFGEAYNKAATMQNSVNAFKKTGLFPCNRHVFNAAEFGLCDDSDLIVETSANIDLNVADSSIMIEDETNPDVSNRSTSPIPGCSYDMPPKSNVSSSIVSPLKINPIPISPKTSRCTRAGSASLITFSPYKRKIEEALKKKKDKEIKQKKIIKGKQSNVKKSGRGRKAQVKSLTSSEDDDVSNYSNESSDAEEEDAECPYCLYYILKIEKVKNGKCQACYKWGHAQCGDKKSGQFLCALCWKK